MITLILIYIATVIFNMFIVWPVYHKFLDDELSYSVLFWIDFLFSFLIVMPLLILLSKLIPKIFKNKLGIYSLICKLWRIK